MGKRWPVVKIAVQHFYPHQASSHPPLEEWQRKVQRQPGDSYGGSILWEPHYYVPSIFAPKWLFHPGDDINQVCRFWGWYLGNHPWPQLWWSLVFRAFVVNFALHSQKDLPNNCQETHSKTYSKSWIWASIRAPLSTEKWDTKVNKNIGVVVQFFVGIMCFLPCFRTAVGLIHAAVHVFVTRKCGNCSFGPLAFRIHYNRSNHAIHVSHAAYTTQCPCCPLAKEESCMLLLYICCAGYKRGLHRF